jgi:hypothetical protein
MSPNPADNPVPKWLRPWTRYCRRIAEQDGRKVFTDQEIGEAIQTAKKERYALWFNRIDKVLSYPRWLLFWAILIGMCFTDGDWFYKLLSWFLVSGTVGQVVTILLSPLAVLFWLIDARYPIKQRFKAWLTGVALFALFASVAVGLLYFLFAHHIGTASRWTQQLYNSSPLVGSAPVPSHSPWLPPELRSPDSAQPSESDVDPADRFAGRYFSVYTAEKPPRDGIGGHLGRKSSRGFTAEEDELNEKEGFQIPASAREYAAVSIAMDINSEIPSTADPWLVEEVGRLRAYAKARGKTLTQIVREKP